MRTPGVLDVPCKWKPGQNLEAKTGQKPDSDNPVSQDLASGGNGVHNFLWWLRRKADTTNQDSEGTNLFEGTFGTSPSCGSCEI